MYFMVAYELWPQLTQCAALSPRLVKAQLWLWFVGMMVLTGPWHWVGLLGMPRRMAYFDYSHPLIQPQAWTVVVSTLGGFVLLASALLFVFILASARKTAQPAEPFGFSIAVHAGAKVPAALNGFRIWVALMVALTVVNYGFPIAQLAMLPGTAVPAIPMGAR